MTTTPKDATSGVGRGALVNMAGEILGSSVPLFYIAITRLRGPELLGLLISASYYFAILLRVAIMGHDKGSLRYVPTTFASEGTPGIDRILTSAMRWTLRASLAVTLLTFAGCGTVMFLELDPKNNDLYFWMICFSAALPAQALAMVTMYAVRGLSKMKPYVLINNVVIPAAFVIFGLPVLIPGVDSLVLAAAFVLSSWLGCFGAISLFRHHFPSFKWSGLLRAKLDGELLSFSIPQGITEVLNFLLARVDVLMLGFFFPERREYAAFYGIASLMASFVKKVRFAFDNSFSPLLAELWAKGDIEELQRQYRIIGQWIYILFVILAGGLIFGAPFTLNFYGSEYVPYWPLVPILIAGRLFNVSFGPAQAALLMSGRSKLEMMNNLAINVTNIALNWWLIQEWNVWGAAVATTISLTVFNAVRVSQVRILLGVRTHLSSMLAISSAGLLSSIPSCALVYLDPYAFGFWNLAALLFFVIAYLFLLRTFGFREEVARVTDLFGRKRRAAKRD